MKALQTVKYVDHAPLGMVEKTLELNYRVPDEKRLAWARPIAAKIENDVPKSKEEVYAREALILHERQKTSVKLQAIRIGDLSIATLPNEVYAITGLKLREWSPFKTHFNIELANGAEGYIPPWSNMNWVATRLGLREPQVWRNDGRKMVSALAEAFMSCPAQQNKVPNTNTDLCGGSAAFTTTLYAMASKHRAVSIRRGLLGAPGVSMRWTVLRLICRGRAPVLGYGGESALKPSAFSGPNNINRSVQIAGGSSEDTSRKHCAKAH
jgi:hypothetical protein